MSRIAQTIFGSQHRQYGPSFLQRSLDRFLEWQQRSSERHHLGQLSDSLLADIGLNRADVEMEASKPFWRG